jgi:hypothetical protein
VAGSYSLAILYREYRNVIEARREAQTAPDMDFHLEGLPDFPTGLHEAVRGYYFTFPSCVFTDNAILSVIGKPPKIKA